MNKLFLLGGLAAACLIAAPAAPALAKQASPIATLDKDNDGTVDLNEINKSAEALFVVLETDSDGTLDQKEVGKHISKKDFAAADPDKSGTLSKDEYLVYVTGLFKEADPDNDGTLDEKEIKSKKGKALLRATQ
ncbi:EF-hand domain-containing protein [Methylocystis sp. 9N]|uniref:EF-hand domain-containing protein n=1 Tax=Methylocystis borbori TaxID=3118750 RepID=A0ABU7XLZ4_9HYPH